jgi:hypothetical protein
MQLRMRYDNSLNVLSTKEETIQHSKNLRSNNNETIVQLNDTLSLKEKTIEAMNKQIERLEEEQSKIINTHPNGFVL